ncbi:MAG TPA: ABC transporter permease [Dehalococcoidia bacterium]|nr:ABC transporter permease [Dehalococcoidia bacterium]
MKLTLNRIQSQLMYDNRSFWRNPAAAFFTFAFPLIFLVVFTSMFGNDVINTPSGMSASGSTFYIPAIITLSVINSSYTGLAMQVTVLRDSGFLKRVYGTPLPVWLFLVSKIIHLTFIGLILIAIVTLFGSLFYGVTLPSHTLLSAICSVILGFCTFSALGLAITTVIPNANAAPAIVNASAIPLLFVSDVFIPLENAPDWIVYVSAIFPVQHLSRMFLSAFDPFVVGSGFEPQHMAIVAIWGIAGLIIAIKRFSWEPRI